MISGHSVLAVIPARGGSKGIRLKNIASLAGRPLLAWTVDVAHRSRYVDRTVLSSEDERATAWLPLPSARITKMSPNAFADVRSNEIFLPSGDHAAR